MRICVTMPWLERYAGGVPVIGTGLVRALKSLGHEVTAVGCGVGDGESIGLPILAAFHTTPIPRTVRPLVNAVIEVDVLHVLGYRDPVGTLAASVARRKGIPYVIEPQGMYQPILRSFQLKRAFERLVGRTLVHKAVFVIAASTLEANEFREAGIPPGQIRVRPNGIASKELRAPVTPRIRSRLGIPDQAPLVCSLGRIGSKKGLPLLVEAVAEIPEAWCLIAGPDDGDGTVEQIVRVRREKGVEDRVVLLVGGLWGGDKRAVLKESDCFCLPSRSENFGIAALEAAILGLPVVLSDRCGGAEWLSPGGSRVIPFGELDLLKDAICEALFDQNIREAAGESAPSIQDSLDWTRLAESQVRIYESALATVTS